MSRRFSLQASLNDSDAFLSRRNFMKLSGGCAALSSTSLLSQILNLQLTQSVAAQTSGGQDYKALVCVFLMGGIDSFNMVAPYEQTEYDEYAATRTNLAVPRTDVLDGNGNLVDAGLLPVFAQNNRRLGIHPGMPEIRDLYNAGDAAIVANVGSLIMPVTQQNFDSVVKPLGLFSHSDLQQHWQTSVPQSRSQTSGWGGRMADILNATYNGTSNVSMNIALDNLNLFQTGSDVVPYVVNQNGATVLHGYGQSGWARDRIYTRFLDNIYPSTADSDLGQIYSDLLQHSLAKTKRVSINAAEQFNAAIATEPATTFPNTGFGNRMKLIARAIAGRESLGHGRQVFFVSEGGWDMHNEVINAQKTKLPQVSQALAAFHQEMTRLGMGNQVTTFTASDFARTLTSNGQGSDHAWGGNHLVIGGSVDGGKVYGDYPESLADGNSLDLGRGRLIATTSVDEYAAELAMWFGIPNDQNLVDVLPNVRTFFTGSGSSGPLGFMNGGGSVSSDGGNGPGGGAGIRFTGTGGGFGGLKRGR